ncbi:MAG: hypothetical protein IK065_03680, partial [Neisseriaceae bacterium]|nr:hypothetical protein [Neisseriaceae bacterium]
MQETEGEFLPLIAIGLGAIAFGMWIKHGENYAKTGEPASVKEVAKAGGSELLTNAIPGGGAVGAVKKAATVGKVVNNAQKAKNAANNTKKVANTVNTVNDTKKVTTTINTTKTSKLNTLTQSKNVVDLSKKAPNSVYNQQAVKKLNQGELVGVTKNGKLGSPREMPATRNPNATANDFVQKYGKLNSGLVKAEQIPMKNGEIFTRYSLGNGGFINFRHAGAASNRTASTTATVEINNAQMRAINGDKTLKLKFPRK